MHLATQSTIIQDIMFPYVDNILPALMENTKLTLKAIEYENLKAALQSFVVITFNINVFRTHFQETDFLLRICDAPLVLGSMVFLELLVRCVVNCDLIGSGRSRFGEDLVAVLESAFHALPSDKQTRLKKRINENAGGHSLPISRSNVRTIQALPWVFDRGDEGGDGAAGGGSTPDEMTRGRGMKAAGPGGRTRKRGGKKKFGMQWIRKKEKDGLAAEEEDEMISDEEGEDSPKVESGVALNVGEGRWPSTSWRGGGPQRLSARIPLVQGGGGVVREVKFPPGGPRSPPP